MDVITINWFTSWGMDGKFQVCLEIINNITGMTAVKTYIHKDRKKAIAIAKVQETRIMNKAMKIYYKNNRGI